MHLCSPCHLTSSLEVGGRGWVSESSLKARTGQSDCAVILHPLPKRLTWGELLRADLLLLTKSLRAGMNTGVVGVEYALLRAVSSRLLGAVVEC